MASREFIKMHGLGNDFVVIDASTAPFAVKPDGVQALADRHVGIGCDQLIVVEPPRDGRSDAFMRIYNADGSEVDACGNATRCVARMLFARAPNRESGAARVVIETGAGLLEAWCDDDDIQAFDDSDTLDIAVDMGPARLDWTEIPLSRDCDTAHLPLASGLLTDPVGVGMGNPHAVFFVDNAAAVPIAELGPALEHAPLFPERANIGVAEVRGPASLRLRVWERGAGLTRACGTGACAAAVAAHRRGLTGRNVDVEVDGGNLRISWREDGHVVMTGPTAVAFRGSFETSLIDMANGPNKPRAPSAVA